MSLATRCTACGTIFRIVEDQLRVSDGWVRCGRCAEIFDARELLFDIERDIPPPWPPQYTPAAAPPEPLPPTPSAPPYVPPPYAPAPTPVATAEPAVAPEPAWMPPPEPEPHVDDLPTGWPSPDTTRHEPRWVDEPQAHAPAEHDAPGGSDVSMDMPMAAPTASAAPVMPEFMRQAQSSARWNRPAVRAAMAVLSLGLALALLLQAAVHFRQALAAMHPGLRPVLSALCGVAGCEIGPWQHIDALTIEATSLSPVSSGVYKLTVTLNNKTSVDVAAPSVDLSLTDANGAEFARRVLGREAMTPVLSHVGAESEQTLTLVFSTGGQRVSGYKVAVFYP